MPRQIPAETIALANSLAEVAVASKGEAMLRSVEIKHLACDHFEIAFRAAMPAAQISTVETDHDRRGHCVDLGI